nr:hypothetical protein GCM10025732_50640 [Glycomyces mayteni]
MTSSIGLYDVGMILVEREIRTAPAEVWAVMSELDRWAELLPTVGGVERLSGPGPIDVGARFRVAQPGLATAVYEVTEWRPGQGFTWAATSGACGPKRSTKRAPTARAAPGSP